MSTNRFFNAFHGTHHVILARFALAALLFCLGISVSPAQVPVEFDRRATAVAQLLAGIRPDDPALARFANSAAWEAHRDAMQSAWTEVRESRLKGIGQWRDKELRKRSEASKTLLYPFSGPDFLNANTLFPDCDLYLFFSLELPGALPDVASMSEKRFDLLLVDVRAAFRDIFERNYFITQYMAKELSTSQLLGTVPVVSIMMALTGHRILSIDSAEPWPERNAAYRAEGAARPTRLARAVKIAFADARTGKPKALWYYSIDATDKALAFYPEFLPYLERHRPTAALLKSASYLLHAPEFRKVRGAILDTADLLVQDDTGIPYKVLRERGWDTRLYGQYAPPIKHFNYGNQPDLDKAFRASAVAELPFPFGYHWKDGKSGLILAWKPGAN